MVLTCYCRVAIMARSCSSREMSIGEGSLYCCCWQDMLCGGGGDGDDDSYSDDS